MTGINCFANELETLDISGLPNLQYLDCSMNELESLDIRSNTNLEWLVCNENSLTELDIRNCPKLEYYEVDRTGVEIIGKPDDEDHDDAYYGFKMKGTKGKNKDEVAALREI